MCCKEPCLVAEWREGVYGYLCINCQHWSPA